MITISCILCISLGQQYHKLAYFVRYSTRAAISHDNSLGSKISHKRFHHNHNISWLQISWDISQYLIVEVFMRYFTKITLSQLCFFVFFSCCPFFPLSSCFAILFSTVGSWGCIVGTVSWYRRILVSFMKHFISSTGALYILVSSYLRILNINFIWPTPRIIVSSYLEYQIF